MPFIAPPDEVGFVAPPSDIEGFSAPSYEVEQPLSLQGGLNLDQDPKLANWGTQTPREDVPLEDINKIIGGAGKAMSETGKAMYHQAMGGAFLATGQPSEAFQESAAIPSEDTGLTPSEEGMRTLNTPSKMLASGTRGLIESAPQMAAVTGAQAMGVPAPLAAGAVFGTTPQGFDPEQAAIGAALPAVGQYTGALTEALASKLGVSKPAALAILNKIGGAGGAASLLGAVQVAHIAQLPPDKREDAFIDAAGNVASMGWLGMIGEHGTPETPSETTPAETETHNASQPAAETSSPPAPVASPSPINNLGDLLDRHKQEIQDMIAKQQSFETPPDEAEVAPEKATLPKDNDVLQSQLENPPTPNENIPQQNQEPSAEDSAVPAATTEATPEAESPPSTVDSGEPEQLRQGSDEKLVGMGGATPEEFESANRNSELSQLTDNIKSTFPIDSPPEKTLPLLDRIKYSAQDAKTRAVEALAKTKAVGDYIWDAYTKTKPWTDDKSAVGRWTYANQKADFEARQFGKEIIKAVPDKIRREAMTNWIQANGDNDVLKARADASEGRIKAGYDVAQRLTPDEKSLASNISQYFDGQLRRGQQSGTLKDGVDGYVTQAWRRESPFTKSLRSEFSDNKLQPDFKYSRQRIFDSYFDGEQAGAVPVDKDIGTLVTAYDQSFNKALSARAFLRDLHEGKASDGRPLVDVAGSGETVEGGKSSALLINPKAKSDATSDYRFIDHPAMRGWKWLKTNDDGTQIMLKGNLQVHPEIADKLSNRLKKSLWRENPVGNAILGVQGAMKQSMLSLSGFHQVQEAIHALGHRVNPANLDQIDFNDPVQKDLVSHGLQIADYKGMEAFSEGLASGPIINKIPILGKRILAPYTEYLFQDYIPRLKVTMAKEALKRNTERYSGTLSKDQISEITASQANHAFGELNYQYIGRNPTVQDTLRAFILAPDFLESRAGFVGQALKPKGREQLAAIGLLAATQYMTARLFNKIMDGDYHWTKPFSYFYKGRQYNIRSVPGDIAHLISDPRSFVYNRLSNILGRGAVEALTGRDDRGVKRDALQQVKDMAGSSIPISLRSRDDQKLWESFIGSMGASSRPYTANNEIEELAKSYKSKNAIKTPFQEIYDADSDVFRPLRVALQSADSDAAQRAYEKLKTTVPQDKIDKSITTYFQKPFTGSRAKDADFVNQLDGTQKQKYEQALNERKASLETFTKIKK